MAFPGYSSWCAPVHNAPRGYCTTASQSHGAWHMSSLGFWLKWLIRVGYMLMWHLYLTSNSLVWTQTLHSLLYALYLRNVSPWVIYLVLHAILCLINRRLFVFMGAPSSEDESTLFVCDDTAGVKTLNLSAFSQGGPSPPVGLWNWAFWEGQTLRFKLGLDLQGSVWPECKDCLRWGGVGWCVPFSPCVCARTCVLACVRAYTRYREVGEETCTLFGGWGCPFP